MWRKGVLQRTPEQKSPLYYASVSLSTAAGSAAAAAATADTAADTAAGTAAAAGKGGGDGRQHSCCVCVLDTFGDGNCMFHAASLVR